MHLDLVFILEVLHLGLEVPFIGFQDVLLVLKVLFELLMNTEVLLMFDLELSQLHRCLLQNMEEAVN